MTNRIYSRLARSTAFDEKGVRTNNMTTETKKIETPVASLRTKHLASKFKIKATHLRRILRSMPAYADGVHTNYKWAEGDTKALAAIEAAIKAAADKKIEAAAKAKAALAAKKLEETAQAKTDAKVK